MSRILIVEDHEDMRQLVRIYLEKEGYVVDCVSSGSEALEKLRGDLPDLVISGILMPGMDGFGLFEAVRADKRTAAVPVIFLTALNDRATLLKALRAGVDDFVSKPFDRAELVSVIRNRLRATARTDAEDDPWTIEQSTPAAAKVAAAPQAAPKPEPKPEAPPPPPKSEPAARPDAPKPEVPPAPPEAAPEPAVPAPPRATPPPPRKGVVLTNKEDPVRFSLSDQSLVGLEAATSKRDTQGTVMFCDVRDFKTFRRGLNGIEVIEVLTQFLLSARNTLATQGGLLVKFLGDGFAALFEPDPDWAEGHEVRALKSALLVVLAAQRLKSWLRVRFPDREFPEFAVGIGVHTGTVSVGTLPKGSPQPYTIGGPAVARCEQLEDLTKSLGWSIVASQETVASAAEVLALGRGAMAPNAGKEETLLVAEVRGPLPEAAGSQEQLKVFSLLEAAVESNTAAIVAQQQGADAGEDGQAVAASGSGQEDNRLPPDPR